MRPLSETWMLWKQGIGVVSYANKIQNNLFREKQTFWYLLTNYFTFAFVLNKRTAIESDRSIAEFLNIGSRVLSPLCPFSSYSKLTNYGCFCGLNLDWPPKSNKTMDSLDKICFEHDWCYIRADKDCSPWSPLMVTFDYGFKEEMVKPLENTVEYKRVEVSLIKKGTQIGHIVLVFSNFGFEYLLILMLCWN